MGGEQKVTLDIVNRRTNARFVVHGYESNAQFYRERYDRYCVRNVLPGWVDVTEGTPAPAGPVSVNRGSW